MSEIKVGDVVMIKAGGNLPADELVTVKDITTLKGVEWALIRVGGRSYRVDVRSLKPTTTTIDINELTALKSELAQRDARIAELEAALTPFAEAAQDAQNFQSYDRRLLRTIGNENKTIPIMIDENAPLTVNHLRAAREALKGSVS